MKHNKSICIISSSKRSIQQQHHQTNKQTATIKMMMMTTTTTTRKLRLLRYNNNNNNNIVLYSCCILFLFQQIYIVSVQADNNNQNNQNNQNSNNNAQQYYSTYYDGTDDGVCMIYDKNDFFTVAVQILLALAAIGSLYIKRYREHPQRTFSTWLFDVSKQGFGACYAHVMNMFIAAVISENIRGENVLDDQCAWYGLSYLIDTTIGLLLAIVGLQLIERLANYYEYRPLQHSGVYYGDTALYHWSCQVIAWIFILTITKLLIYLFMWIFSSQLAWIGSTLFAPFNGYKHFELLFVMIFFPGILNVIYFWIADSYLKATDDQIEAHVHDETGLQDKKESLLTNTDTEMVGTTSTTTSIPTWSALSGTKNTIGTSTTPEPAAASTTTTTTVV